jgi:FkbM family methyltransferase
MRLFFKILFRENYHLLNNKVHREFLRLVFKYGDKPRYKNEKIRTSKYVLTVPDCLSFIWQYKEIFADENYKFNTERNLPVIYDCGANIGISCLYFKKIFPFAKIKAFEADPTIAQILIGNLMQNNYYDVEVIPKAVWIHNNGVELSSEGADASTIYSNKNIIKVESVRLKELLQAEELVDLLKIDIEGAETDVLKDCEDSLSNVKNIFIEYHSFINNTQALNEILDVLSINKFRYFIKQPLDREKPFINKINKNSPEIDLQLNIYGYKD